MKKTLVVMFALTALFFGLATAASAGGSPALKVKIPFAFHVGNSLLPAGEYVFEMPNAFGNMATGATLRVQSQDGSICYTLFTVPGGTYGTPAHQLVFNKYSGSYFLTKVQTGTFESNLPKSRAEKELSIAALKGLGEKSSAEVIRASSN